MLYFQGYGLTETCGAACVADINDLSTGTVGPPVRCAQIVLRYQMMKIIGMRVG